MSLNSRGMVQICRSWPRHNSDLVSRNRDLTREHMGYVAASRTDRDRLLTSEPRRDDVGQADTEWGIGWRVERSH